MLYRGMDRPQLDAAYDNRAAVANVDEIKADWLERGDRIRRTHSEHQRLLG